MKSVVNSNKDRLLLSLVGNQVRRVRQVNGITRKELSRRSGVSQRYLAKLEAGDGNASILLLKHISDALGLPLGNLLADETVSEELVDVQEFVKHLSKSKLVKAKEILVQSFNSSYPKKHIALVGLRGAGKSTLGAALAQSLGRQFVEIDKKIESLAGITLSEIFSLYGQDGYRRFEKACLVDVLNKEESCVIETGGSVVTHKESYDMILSSCFTVWIKADPEDHMNRVISQGDTRIISSTHRIREDVQQILKNREPLYALADKTVNTSKFNKENCLRELSKMVVIGREE